MGVLISLLIILFSSLVIYLAGNRFADASSNVGDYLRLPRDVKGATFDAISSSLPELLVALYSVIFFKQFEVGVGTIAGSALFNLLVIPGIAVFFAPVAFKVSKKVISRDALFYMAAVFLLIILLTYFKFWGLGIAIILLAMYLLYLTDIFVYSKKYREKKKRVKREINIFSEVVILIILLVVIGVATFALTDSAIDLSDELGVPAIIIAFTIVAAATSVPDTVISVVNAKKGNIDDATSNVFGSNVFDIFVGLGLPLLIFVLFGNVLEITFTNLEIVFGLLGSTILVLYFLIDSHTLTKKHATIMLLMYFVFLLYVIFLAI